MATSETKRKEKPAEAAEINKEKGVAVPSDEKKTEGETFTREQVDVIVASAVEAAVEKVRSEMESAKAENATVLQVAQQEYVTLMFVGSMAAGSEVALGAFGKINRAFGTIDVPKKDFLQNRDFMVDRLLEKKKLIVIDGLDEQDRERFGLLYRDGELLEPNVFLHILDFSEDEVAALFSKLCDSHMRTVATTFITAYEKGDARVTQEKAKRLNDISKKVDADGLFTSILEDMGRKLSD